MFDEYRLLFGKENVSIIIKTLKMETLEKKIGALSEEDETISTRMKRFFRSPRSDTKKAYKKIKLFLVDDDPLYLKALEMSITTSIKSDMAINSFQTGEACLQQMKQKPNVVILDYFLNSKLPYAWDGITILKQIKKISPGTKVIMLSAQDSLRIAIECMENGAYDYISKTKTAFVRINNALRNIIGNIEVTSWFFRFSGYVLLIVIIILIAYSILNH